MQVSQSLSQQDHVSADDVERYEIIDGVRVEREPMGAFETVLASWLCYVINSFAAGKKIGLAGNKKLFLVYAGPPPQCLPHRGLVASCPFAPPPLAAWPASLRLAP